MGTSQKAEQNLSTTLGRRSMDDVAERINGDASLWAPVKKKNNRMYMSGNKKQTVKIRDQSVDLK